MRQSAAVITAVVLLLAVLAAVSPAPAEAALRLVRVASGLSQPVHLASNASERKRLYVVERAGVVRLIVKGRVRSTPFLDIRDRVACCNGEQGLLSVAFHPRYGSTGKLYVNYTNRRGDTRVVQFRANAARTRAMKSSARVLLSVAQPASNHNGGQLAFGPDGFLYVATGDGGRGCDPWGNAQKMSSRLGKLLRLNVSRIGSAPAVAGLGLRNPWRFSFDRRTGNLWIADVGQNRWEEIDFTPRRSPGIENYGWDVFEGRERDTCAHGPLNRSSRLVWPIHQYGHANNRCSITGGFVYRGPITSIRGRYFYGDFCSGEVWSFRYANRRKSGFRRESFRMPGYSLVSFGEARNGALYLVAQSGTIYRLASA